MTTAFSSAQLRDLAPAVEALARRVGRALAEISRSLHPDPTDVGKSASTLAGWQAFAKTDGSPVTSADLLADEMLRAGLADLLPGVRIVSEESHPPAGDAALDAKPENDFGGDRFWLVDPLDGTRAFLAGSTAYCICVALVDQGRPIFGLIHAPATATSWWSWRGAKQVWRSSSADGSTVLRKRDLLDSKRASPRLAISEYHRAPEVAAWLARYPNAETVATSSALKFCALVEDRVDLYPRPGQTMGWDTAAGQCLVEEAGGVVLALEGGSPLRYDVRELRNPGFVASFVADD